MDFPLLWYNSSANSAQYGAQNIVMMPMCDERDLQAARTREHVGARVKLSKLGSFTSTHGNGIIA